jgi:hypothetical protein
MRCSLNGHGRFYGGQSTPMAGKVQAQGDPIDAMAARLNLLVEGMDAMVLKEDVDLVRSLKGKPIPEDSSRSAASTSRACTALPRQRTGAGHAEARARGAGHVGRRNLRVSRTS